MVGSVSVAQLGAVYSSLVYLNRKKKMNGRYSECRLTNSYFSWCQVGYKLAQASYRYLTQNENDLSSSRRLALNTCLMISSCMLCFGQSRSTVDSSVLNGACSIVWIH